MVLAVIDIDLFVPGLEFILGEADPVNGNAVISLARLRQEFYNKNSDLQLFINRTIKTALYGIGCLYGLRNCPDRKCVMCFSGSVEDTDYKDILFCHICRNILINQLNS